MLSDGPLDRGVSQVVLYGTAIVLVSLIVSSLRTRKFSGAASWALNSFALLIVALHVIRWTV